MKNNLSHPELVQNDERLLFDDEDEIFSKVEALLESTFSVAHYAEHYMENSIKNIILTIENLP